MKFLKIAVFIIGAASMAAAASFDNLNVYPNPVRKDRGNATLTFDALPDPVRIRIYDAQGRLVREETQAAAGAAFVWDLKNQSGLFVSPGIYLYLLTDGAGQNKKGKIAILQ